MVLISLLSGEKHSIIICCPDSTDVTALQVLYWRKAEAMLLLFACGSGWSAARQGRRQAG